MKIYEVNFLTEMYVEAENAKEATMIAERHLVDEVNNGLSKVDLIVEVLELGSLSTPTLASLPWRLRERRNEPEETILEILKREIT